MSDVHEWIGSLTFVELYCGDCDAFDIALTYHRYPKMGFHSTFGDNKHFTQLALRFECGLDFCKGRVGKRKEFDWTQGVENIYRFLLIDYWRNNALYWSHRNFPEPIKKPKSLGQKSFEDFFRHGDN